MGCRRQLNRQHLCFFQVLLWCPFEDGPIFEVGFGRFLFRVLFRRENRLTQELLDDQRGRIFLETETDALTWRVLFAGGMATLISDAVELKRICFSLRNADDSQSKGATGTDFAIFYSQWFWDKRSRASAASLRPGDQSLSTVEIPLFVTRRVAHPFALFAKGWGAMLPALSIAHPLQTPQRMGHPTFQPLPAKRNRLS